MRCRLRCGRAFSNLVFLVVRDGDQELRVPVVHGWAKIVTDGKSKIIRVACGCGVAQLSELLVRIAFSVAMARLCGIL